MSTKRLDGEDRAFLRALAEVIFGNPFADLPPEISEVVSNEVPTSGHRHDHYLPVLVPATEARLKALPWATLCVNCAD